MTVEFERLTEEIQNLAQVAYQRQLLSSDVLARAAELLRTTSNEVIVAGVNAALELVGEGDVHAALPLETERRPAAVIDAPPVPDEATLIATDGSQILPDLHAAYLYALINIGVVTYFHGQVRAPVTNSVPQLTYPDHGQQDYPLAEDGFTDSGAIVNLRRDLREIEMLAASAWNMPEGASRPWLALLDQRLLYWPTIAAGNAEGKRILDGWQEAMSALRKSGALLCGYITRPAKRSVLTMLQALDALEPGFSAELLERRPEPGEPTDAHLFRRFLSPGQRSVVFVDVSRHNRDFRLRDPLNEVCFFYLNPGQFGDQIARVDIPMWVAQDAAAVTAVHALVYDQCRIMGNYPYILTRADEEAVVRFRDRENLEVMIANAMQRFGLSGEATPKQSGKDVARAGKTRHELRG